jgi:preprotein translocase subunit SecD
VSERADKKDKNNQNNQNNQNDQDTDPQAEPTDAPTQTPTAPVTVGGEEIPAELQQQYAELDCSDPEQLSVGAQFADDEPAIACDRNGVEKFLLAPVAVSGSDVDTAQASLAQNTAGWIVSLDFNGDGTKSFGEITAEMATQPPDSPGNRFAIVLDGLVVSAPGVNEAIPGGQAQITGQFTQDEAQDLANVLKFGALPLTFEIGERNTISPTLGEDQLQAGLVAGALGLALVVLYLLLYYRALALVAVFSLVIAGALVYASVVILGETLNFALTLAGVAGLIVAIGITADSFIVYFERIRDEVREGRSLRAALESGWVRARRTIIAADFISLIAAVVLWVLSVGGVRGFAFTLGLTTIIDLLVVFLFTKPLVSLLARTRFFQSGSRWSGLSPERLGAKKVVAPERAGKPSRRTVKEA